ncbi:TonB-dependent receptor [Agaribacter marinus]|uniref:Oar protein n=1 Tax=Agaribacter marinus TaxID=1431249 RepID=A0AA37WK71_9ALTE|nr:TonB-dependent receptor [Agaribacter marinus]GLR71149.1 Oar protein [Agaribacter marinus]
MLSKTKLSKLAVAVALSVGLSTTAIANSGQSSAMRGVVVGPSGNPAPDATITIIHNASGTVKTVNANSDGAFSARGLRVGGPYTITISSDTFQGQVIDDVFVSLNDTFELNTQLTPKQSLEKITVVGSRDFFANSGANSSFGEDYINSVATVNRDLKDVIRANPLAVVDPSGETLSIAGSNPKFNAVTIDGVGINDTFGLQGNGYPTNRPPISLDAVEQVSVEFAPFKARAGEFSGGNINVVTKSGTNEISGSVFYEQFPTAGDAVDDRISENEFEVDNKEESYGFTFGAPIIKDKLFVFASYEKFEEDIVLDFNPSTYPAEVIEEVNRVADILNSTYGISDAIGGAPAPDEDTKLLIKLDWNISENHRADFTYSDQDGSSAEAFNDDPDEVRFASNAWTREQTNTFYTAHLYSDWTDVFSSEFSLSYKEFEQASITNSSLGEVNVRGESGVDFIIGQDEFRHANELGNEVLSIGFHANYFPNEVEYNFGVEVEKTNNFNLFVEDSDGVWGFDSLASFENRTPEEFVYGNAFTNNPNDASYDVETMQTVLYADATFDLFEDFTVTAGLRYEHLSADGSPNLNANFVNTYGFENTENLDGFDILLPRIGFEWDASENVTVRGGVGRFSGGFPLVWVANAYTVDGVTIDSVEFDDVSGADVNFNAIPQRAVDALVQGAGNTNSIDPDFEMPSDWRYQIATDVVFDIPSLGEDFAWSTEFIYVDKQDGAYWIDLSRVDNGRRTVDGGRIIWDNVYDNTDFAGNHDIQLTNSDDAGESLIFTTSLSKIWDNGISFSGSYTNQDITEANPGTSSRAISNYQFEVVENRNTPLVDTAFYEIEHRLVFNFGYKTELFAGYETNVNLFFERRSGRPFSWTLGAFRDGDLGDQSDLDDSDVYLPYIPTGPNDPAVDFSAGLSYEEIAAVFEQAGLTGTPGGFGGKYDSTQPWVTTSDLYVSQEIPGFTEEHKGLVYFTIANFANFLNDDWGKFYDFRFPQQIIVDYDVNDAGQYVYQERFRGTDTRNFNQFNVEESAWRLKIGVKYTF